MIRKLVVVGLAATLMGITLFALPNFSMGIANFGQQWQTYYNLQMAASLLMVIPVITLFLVLQRYFIKGIMLSGLKA